MEGQPGQKWNTPRYRTLGNSQVDESLFGFDKNDGRKVLTGPLPPSAIVLSAKELMKIKNSAVIKTEKDLMEERQEAEAIKADRERKARERKIRMKELEEAAQLMAKKSDIEVAKMAREAAIRNRATEKQDKNNDVIKLLNSMSARAVAFTIRDEQLKEKERREKTEEEYNQRMDILMEIDRIKDIERREEEEQQKRKKRIEDRKVITEQMQQREKAKVLEAERVEQENVMMRNKMKKYQEEDSLAELQRAEMIARTKQQARVYHEETLRRKEEAKERERKEQEDILLYQALKDAELAKREEEEALIEKAKKERQALLLAQQEKAQNNAGKLDEIRARRASEEKERKERIKEKEESIKRKEEMKVLLDARAVQAMDKKVRLEREKIALEDEYKNALLHMAKMAEREELEEKSKIEKSFKHRNGIMEQISTRAIVRDSSKNNKYEEGTKFRQEFVREEAKMNVIRERMVKDLEQKGVNPRYLSEMKNVDVGKIINR